MKINAEDEKKNEVISGTKLFALDFLIDSFL
jgi:hypothetical protein